ncbi:MAG TPA: SEC-C metal-binding domain-containing protein, partial [Chthonomonadaceae bacterium]|nr:SEC-C metal-binding domain-containing protein [Chthonomonadaceae bacterium]
MRTTKTRRTGRSKPARPAPTPTRPEHQFPEPYSRLLALGRGDYADEYERLASRLRADAPDQAAANLVAVVLDERFYEYEDRSTPDGDARTWTPLHALRVLGRMGAVAHAGIEPLLALLDVEDDYLREDLPFYYAAVGGPAIEALVRVLVDSSRPLLARATAAESLSEIGQQWPDLRDEVVGLLTDTLVAERTDDEVNSCIVEALMDVGARESMPEIEAAFREGRVDESIVDLDYVLEHLGLPPVAALPNDRRQPAADPSGGSQRAVTGSAAGVSADSDRSDSEWSEPYVAPVRPGRNDPCPCGSGKKFKKCCGA